jgi:uroporphyrinogen decarboxylase
MDLQALPCNKPFTARLEEQNNQEASLNKIERVMNTLEGREVDRPPFGFWYHFGLQHMPGRYHAEAEIDFYQAYDLDFLKVMNDYAYPLPEGTEALCDEDGWRRVEPVNLKAGAWSEQLAALSIIKNALAKEAMFVETVFSPWTTARRLTPTGSLTEARNLFPQTLLTAMDSIATSLAEYAAEAIARGASGIFLSLGAATDDVMTAEEYQIWGRPFDLKILEAVKESPFNILHIHGRHIHFDPLMSYPASAINWSHATTEPSLQEGRRRSGKAVMGGIDETASAHLSPAEMRKRIAEAIRGFAGTGLIVAPGCSVATDTPERTLRAIKDAIEV